MLKKIQKKSSGFTIIEVMIVLAIAGLIILIVLLAVPALQRNARNTAIKNDASAVAAAVNEYKSNNDGATPKGMREFTVGGQVKAGQFELFKDPNNPPQANSDEVPTQFKVQSDTQTCIAPGNTKPTTGTENCGKGGATSMNGNILMTTGKTCDATNGSTNPRAVAIYYPVEQASGDPKPKCIDS